MHSALFVAKKNSNQSWAEFDAAVKREAETIGKYAIQLSENVWLASFRESPAALALIVAFAEKQGIPYGILQLECEPQWLPVGFDPKPPQNRSS